VEELFQTVKIKNKVLNDTMEELKSLIPDDPTGLLRTRYKYIHSKTSVYILA